MNSDGIGLDTLRSEAARSCSALSLISAGGADNLNLDGVYGKDDSRPMSNDIVAKVKRDADIPAAK